MNWTVEQQIIAALDTVYMRFDKGSFPELEAGFQGVERQFAGLLEDADYLEVKRRVAEGTLLAAEMTEQPVDRCRELLGRVEQLGWSTLYAKANVLGAFSRYCLNHGRKELGLYFLAPIIAELEKDSAPPDKAAFEVWLEKLRRLLAQLQA